MFRRIIALSPRKLSAVCEKVEKNRREGMDFVRKLTVGQGGRRTA